MARTIIIAVSFSCALLVLGLAACQEKTTILSSSPTTPASPSTAVTASIPSTTSTVTSGNLVRLEGALSSLAGSCPTVTFTIDHTSVSTTMSTQFSGQTCAKLTNGLTIVVDGTLQNGTLIATDVRNEVLVGPIVQARGTVSGLQGTCPGVTFTVNSTTVTTSQNTRFIGPTCAQLTNGLTIVVDGTLQNGSVVAGEVYQWP